MAISLVNKGERFALEKIAKEYSIPMQERPIPSDEDVANIVAERLTALLEARLRSRDRLATERSHRFESLARSLAETEDESALITMLLDDYYQQSLHASILQPSDTPGGSVPPARPTRRAHESNSQGTGSSGNRRRR